uniref:Uncharacterized protein n=1 Tax=Anguilla anguilla TaxID=7936 RepID=A0A0E9R9Z4_ANGAN
MQDGCLQIIPCCSQFVHILSGCVCILYVHIYRKCLVNNIIKQSISTDLGFV